MNPLPDSPAARLLRVDLDRWGEYERPAPGALERLPAHALPEPFARMGRVGGPALALGVLLDAARRGDARAGGPLVVSVGAAVTAGLPTAARASVSARSPLTGRLAEGQVGSDLARRLARHVDALVLEGRASGDAGVLVLREDGELLLLQRPSLGGLGPEALRRALVVEFPGASVLRTGPAARAGVPFANLAAGGDPPSFVGRGGLGAALARHGLLALVISGPAAPDHPASGARDAALRAALLDSPRLAARAAGGTLELFHAAAARGDASVADAHPPRAEHHGCQGCPTPCGWAFRSPGGERSVARFGALSALGPQLGLADPEVARSLLARCNELGLDAREAAARLAASGRTTSTPELLAALDDLLCDPGPVGPVAEAHRPTRDVAARLGQVVGLRGADPMRTFPFLVGEGADPQRVARLLAPVPVDERVLDPLDPSGKGRLVWWHENLVTALDALGFCAFSAAGLLTDGTLDLDGLARELLPERVAEALGGGDSGASPGANLLALGASLDLGVALLHEAWGVDPAPVPEDLAGPGLWSEYRRFRGLDAHGRPTAAARAALGRPEVLAIRGPDDPRLEGPPEPSLAPRVPAVPLPASSLAPGRVRLVGGSALGDRLGPGGELQLELELPSTVTAVLEAAARARPRAADWLLREGRPLPGVWRSGRPLDSLELVHDGERLDLVLAVAGG